MVTERFHVEPQGPTLYLRGGEDAPKAPLVIEWNGTWYRRVGLLTLWAYFNEPDATRNEDPPVVRAEILADLERLGGIYGRTLLDGVMHFAFPSEERLREFEARWLQDEIR